MKISLNGSQVVSTTIFHEPPPEEALWHFNRV